MIEGSPSVHPYTCGCLKVHVWSTKKKEGRDLGVLAKSRSSLPNFTTTATVVYAPRVIVPVQQPPLALPCSSSTTASSVLALKDVTRRQAFAKPPPLTVCLTHRKSQHQRWPAGASPTSPL